MQIHNYTNEELQTKHDKMALVMFLKKFKAQKMMELSFVYMVKIKDLAELAKSFIICDVLFVPLNSDRISYKEISQASYSRITHWIAASALTMKACSGWVPMFRQYTAA